MATATDYRRLADATAAFRAGDFAAALRLWGDALAASPASSAPTAAAALLTNKGACLERLGRLPEAIDAYDAALAASPGHIDALHNKGCTLRQLGLTEAALACFERAVASSNGCDAAAASSFFPALRGIASCCLSLGRFVEAADAAAIASAQRPEDPAPVADRAFALLKASGLCIVDGVAGRRLALLTEAVRCYERAQALGDASNETRRLLGVTLSHLAVAQDAAGEHERAEASYEAALAVEPTETRLFNLALLHLRMQRAESAVEGFARVCALNPAQAQAHAALGTLLLQLGRPAEALVELVAARAVGSSEVGAEVAYNQGLAEMLLQQPLRACVAFQAALDAEPTLAAAVAGLEAARLAAASALVSVPASGLTSPSAAPFTAPSPPMTLASPPASEAPAPLASGRRIELRRASSVARASVLELEPQTLLSACEASLPHAPAAPSELSAASTVALPPQHLPISPTDHNDEEDDLLSPSARYRLNTTSADDDGFDGLIVAAHDLQGPGASVPGVKVKYREVYLSSADFRRLFGMPKRAFFALAKWRRLELKRSVDLF